MAKEIIIKDGDGNQLLPKTKAEFVVTSDGGTVEARMTLADNSYQKIDGVEINSEGFKTDQSELTDSRLTVDGGINIFKTSVEFAPENEGNEVKVYADSDELYLKASQGIYLDTDNSDIVIQGGNVEIDENLCVGGNAVVAGTLKDISGNEYAKKNDVYSVVDGVGIGSRGVTLAKNKSVKLGSKNEISTSNDDNEILKIYGDNLDIYGKVGLSICSPSISLTSSGSSFDFVGNMYLDGNLGVGGTLKDGDDNDYALKKDVVLKGGDECIQINSEDGIEIHTDNSNYTQIGREGVFLEGNDSACATWKDIISASEKIDDKVDKADGMVLISEDVASLITYDEANDEISIDSIALTCCDEDSVRYNVGNEIRDLKNGKVNTETGKGLIDSNVASHMTYDAEENRVIISDAVVNDALMVTALAEFSEGVSVEGDAVFVNKVSIGDVNDVEKALIPIRISSWSDDEFPNVGEYVYAPTAKKLWLGVADAGGTSKQSVQMNKAVIYVYNHQVYLFNGTELV